MKYMADDGTIFNTERQCLDYEAKKYEVLVNDVILKMDEVMDIPIPTRMKLQTAMMNVLRGE